MHALKDYSCSVGTEAVEVYPALHALAAVGTPTSTGGLSHLRIWNISSVTIWLSRSGQAAVRQPGSYPLRAGEREEHDVPYLPLEALSAVAEADGAGLTVELWHLARVFTTAANA
ncbi:MAG: hypothetical protein RQ966_16960 [Acetobacteraceae bacterium]|nr:hypothetical protein [Acetobacteraceae bacterium]